MITRRRLLLMLAAVGGTAALVQLPWQRITQLPAANWFSNGSGMGSATDAVLLELNETQPIGRAWLALQAETPSMEQLAARLAARIGEAETITQVRARLADLVADDHASSNLCEVDGWQLSATECEIAALRWLAYGSAASSDADQASDASSAADPMIGEIVEVTNWGPQGTEQGLKVNEQSDGHSGIWIAASGAPPWIVVMIDGKEAPTVVSDKAVTSGLHGELQTRVLGTPGAYSIALLDPIRRVLQPVGEFVVRPRSERALRADGTRSEVFCVVQRWGPESTPRGVAENAQSDGSMGMWFALACVPSRVELLFGEDALPTTRTEFGITSRVPLPLLQVSGSVALILRDRDSGEQMTVGEFRIAEPTAASAERGGSSPL